MHTEISRRSFTGGVFSLGLFSTMSFAGLVPVKRWYKGNLHMHTYWSDGKAFPEEAVEWYVKNGYNFIGISDHNVFQENPNNWKKVADPAKKIRGIEKKAAQEYLKKYPDAESRKDKNGNLEIRQKTFAELSKAYNKNGEFLLIPAVEATRYTVFDNKRTHHVHLNYINLPGLLPSYKAKNFTWRVKNREIPGFIAEHVRETAEYAKTLGRPYILMLNHPVWCWYDIAPEDLIENPEVLFFEVCNNGSAHKPPKGLPEDGFDTDRFWDIVNAFRARRSQKFLYGVGTDDTHLYRGEKVPSGMPGNSWIRVRSNSLSNDAIVKAMLDGDFIACENLELEDVVFHRDERRLEVSVGAKTAVSRTIKFIVTKKDFSEKPVRTITVRPSDRPETPLLERKINIYDEKIGMTVKTVKSGVGEAIRASYTMHDDDLYVRARVEESGEPLCKSHLHPQGKFVAWTQPYA